MPSSRPSRLLALVAAVWALGACTDDATLDGRRGVDDLRARGSTPGMSPIPQAISFLGGDLYTAPMDSAAAVRLEARLDTAEVAYEADPTDPDALVWLGRHLAYTGRYRSAIDAFTEGIGRFPDDARFYRHRGHRYITVRELDRAIADLEHAARLISGTEDVVEPDGLPNEAGLPRSTLHTNVWYHLGLARYLAGDFEGAVHAYRRGLEISPNDDMRVAMADWLWMALMRLEREAEAREAIAFVEPSMDILENDAYHRRLLLYRGMLDADSVAPDLELPPARDDGEGLARAASPRAEPRALREADLQLATYGYGLGTWYLVRGDRIRARRYFEAVLGTGYWPAFGYIASEAELARMEEPPVPEPLPASRELRTGPDGTSD